MKSSSQRGRGRGRGLRNLPSKKDTRIDRFQLVWNLGLRKMEWIGKKMTDTHTHVGFESVEFRESLGEGRRGFQERLGADRWRMYCLQFSERL